MIPFEIIGFCFLVVVVMIVKIYVKVLLIGLGVVSGIWSCHQDSEPPQSRCHQRVSVT